MNNTFNKKTLEKKDKKCYNKTLIRGGIIMNNKKFKFKTIFTLILTSIVLVLSITNTNAEDKSIDLGNATMINGYIAGVAFEDKTSVNGDYLYCLNMHKNTARNIKANLVSNSKYIDGGIVYILKNGYPNKTITGDNSKDYYITQTAVWWYLDNTQGMSNLGEQFKSTGSDDYDLRKYVKQLVNDATKHKNDSITINDIKFEVTSTSDSMTVENGYYVTKEIKATTISNISSYTVKINNAPSGTIVITNGKESTYTKDFVVKANESFIVKVPVSSVKEGLREIKISATARGIDQYTAHEYQPVDTSMQNVALLEKVVTNTSSDVTLRIASSKVTIYKVDEKTKETLAGAVLVVKDSTGKIIDRFETTTSSHVITDLANGTYTVEEETAPAGYIKSNQNITFTIDDNHLLHEITFVNTKGVVVPDTNTTSIILLVLGIIIIGTGSLYIYKNGKRI